MRTIRTKLYKFTELSTEAKQKAVDQWRNNSDSEPFWSGENRETLEKFAEIFPIKITHWSYGERGERVDFHFTSEDYIEELSGQRLATYIWNNYRTEIYSKKYYTGTQRTKPNPYFKNNPQAPQFTTWDRYSKIQIEKYSCPLSGFYLDNEILHEIWQFLDKPDSRNFKELLSECFNAWVKACNLDMQEQNSYEVISERLEANEYEFLKDGQRY